MSRPADVLVVGAGPAGSALALRLCRLGLHVVLVDQAPGPRPHVGEAVSAGFLRQLSFLGCEGLAQHAGQLAFAFSEEAWAEAQFSQRPAPPGAGTIDRGRFDAALRDAARAAGVDVVLGGRVTRLSRETEGWTAQLGAGADAPQLRARFVVDAAGRGGVLPRRRRRLGARTMAVFAYWRGDTPRHPRVCAGVDHWAWGAPVAGLGFSAMVFTDRAGLADRPGTLTSRYDDLLPKSGLLADTPDATRVSPVAVCDATAWFDEAPVGPDALKVGEAALALDPLAASGVQMALQTAAWAAPTLNTLLRRPHAAADAAAFYAERLRASAAAHQAWIAEIYRSAAGFADRPFWRARAELAGPPVLAEDRPAPAAPEVVETPCLVGDFIALRRAVRLPNSGDLVAYVDGLEVAALMDQVRAAGSPAAAAAELGARFGPGRAARVLDWLISRGLAEAAPAG